MDIHHPLKSKICLEHNQPIVAVNSIPKIEDCCLICLQNLPSMKLAKYIFNQQQEIYIYENHQLLEQFFNCLLIYKESIISSLDNIKQLIEDQIANVNQSQSELDLILKYDGEQSKLIQDLEYAYTQQQKFTTEIKDQLENQLQCFQSQFFDIEKLFAISLGRNEGQKVQEIQIKSYQIMIQKTKTQSESMPKKFLYELIKESSFKQRKSAMHLLSIKIILFQLLRVKRLQLFINSQKAKFQIKLKPCIIILSQLIVCTS